MQTGGLTCDRARYHAESAGNRIGAANQSARRELIRAQCLSCLHGLLRVLRPCLNTEYGVNGGIANIVSGVILLI